VSPSDASPSCPDRSGEALPGVFREAALKITSQSLLTGIVTCATMVTMDTRMTRIDVDDATWRRFRAQCLEMGMTTPERLGALVRGAATRKEKRRQTWVRE
jgi:hypothetical protein